MSFNTTISREEFAADPFYSDAVRQYARSVAAIGSVEAAALSGQELALTPDQLQDLARFEEAITTLASYSVQPLMLIDPESSKKAWEVERAVIDEGLCEANVDEPGCERAMAAFVNKAHRIICQAVREINARTTFNAEDIEGILQDYVDRGLFSTLNEARTAFFKVPR